MDMMIRPARREDANALTALAMASKQSNGYDDAFMAACAGELRVTPALIGAHDYLIAESDMPCGFVCLRADPEGGSGEIGSFFVHPDRQGRGIGRLLWAAALEAARGRKLTMLRLDADPGAEAFYRGLGFATVGRVPSGSIAGRTLPHMRIDLGG